MASLNNPAGRLHEILVGYQRARAAGDGQALSTIWASALGGETLDIGLSRVAALIPAIADAAEASGDEMLLRLVRHHSGSWVEPILFPPSAAEPGRHWGSGSDPRGRHDRPGVNVLHPLALPARGAGTARRGPRLAAGGT